MTLDKVVETGEKVESLTGLKKDVIEIAEDALLRGRTWGIEDRARYMQEALELIKETCGVPTPIDASPDKK